MDLKTLASHIGVGLELVEAAAGRIVSSLDAAKIINSSLITKEYFN